MGGRLTRFLSRANPRVGVRSGSARGSVWAFWMQSGSIGSHRGKQSWREKRRDGGAIFESKSLEDFRPVRPSYSGRRNL